MQVKFPGSKSEYLSGLVHYAAKYSHSTKPWNNKDIAYFKGYLPKHFRGGIYPLLAVMLSEGLNYLDFYRNSRIELTLYPCNNNELQNLIISTREPEYSLFVDLMLSWDIEVREKLINTLEAYIKKDYITE